MQLWEEYLIRHRMPIVNPYKVVFESDFSIIIRNRPSSEERIWNYFLTHHQIQIFNVLEMIDQQRSLFARFPVLEMLWSGWQDNSFPNLSNVPIIHA